MPKKRSEEYGTSNIKTARRFFRFAKFGMRVSKVPLLGRIVKKIIDPEHSHGSEIPINKSLELPDNVILPFAVTEHFVAKASYIFKMNYCGCRKIGKCEDHDVSIGCLWLGEAVSRIDVPPEIGQIVTKEEALEHLHLAYENGLVTSIGRMRGDSWLMGVLPDEGRFMSLCNCCPCCCILGKFRYATKEIRDIIQRMEGLTVEVNQEICVGCGTCATVCIFKDAMKMVNGKAMIDQDNCKGCGRCARKCPKGAITITLDNIDSINLTIDRISSYVDVT